MLQTWSSSRFRHELNIFDFSPVSEWEHPATTKGSPKTLFVCSVASESRWLHLWNWYFRILCIKRMASTTGCWIQRQQWKIRIWMCVCRQKTVPSWRWAMHWSLRSIAIRCIRRCKCAIWMRFWKYWTKTIFFFNEYHQIESYDIETGCKETLPRMPNRGRSMFWSIAVGKYIYIFGGQDQEQQPINECLWYVNKLIYLCLV